MKHSFYSQLSQPFSENQAQIVSNSRIEYARSSHTDILKNSQSIGIIFKSQEVDTQLEAVRGKG